MDETVIGRRIKFLREEKGVTQAQLADDIGLTRLSIGNYEQSKRLPDVTTIVKLAEYFGCDTGYLLGQSNFINNNEMQQVYTSIESFNDKLSGINEQSAKNFIFELNLLIDSCKNVQGKITRVDVLDAFSSIVSDYKHFLNKTNNMLELLGNENTKSQVTFNDVMHLMQMRLDIKNTVDLKTGKILEEVTGTEEISILRLNNDKKKR